MDKLLRITDGLSYIIRAISFRICIIFPNFAVNIYYIIAAKNGMENIL